MLKLNTCTPHIYKYTTRVLLSKCNSGIVNCMNQYHCIASMSQSQYNYDTLNQLTKHELIDIILRQTNTNQPIHNNFSMDTINNNTTFYLHNNSTAIPNNNINSTTHPNKRLKLQQNVSNNIKHNINPNKDYTLYKPISDVAPQLSKQFDATKYRYRLIVLHIAYIGTNYHGFALQNHYKYNEKPMKAHQHAENDVTVESELMDALIKLKLILPNINCKYSRCGRTDKGR